MNLKVSDARRDEGGFTLIELLVVVIIIGILAAIAIPVFLNQRQSAWQGSAESDVRNAAIQIETDATRNRGGTYPETVTAADFQFSENVTVFYLPSADGDNATAYTMCAEHSLVGGAVTYDSEAGGVQDWVEAADAALGCANDGRFDTTAALAQQIN